MRSHDNGANPRARQVRKPIPKRVRFAVLRRDGFACRYCGRKAPEIVLEIDHIVALATGGTDDIENLAASCRDCNGGKGTLALGRPIPAGDREFYCLHAPYGTIIAHGEVIIKNGRPWKMLNYDLTEAIEEQYLISSKEELGPRYKWFGNKQSRDDHMKSWGEANG